MPRPEALACLRVALPNLHIRIAITNKFFGATLAGFHNKLLAGTRRAPRLVARHLCFADHY